MILNFTKVKLSRAKVFLICNLIFIGGIALASFLPRGLIVYEFCWFAGAVGGATAAVLFWPRRAVRVGALTTACLFFGLWRFAVGLPELTPAHIAYYNGQNVTVTGIVSDEPDRRETKQKLEVKIKNLELKTNREGDENNVRKGKRPVKGKILVTTELYPVYKYGDELRLECEQKAPEEFDGFAYDRYLARYDIYAVCYYPPIEKTGAVKGNGFYAALFNFKHLLYAVMDRGLDEPAASFARALILGDKKGMSAELKDNFARSGLSHLAAISGDCISIIAAMAMTSLLWLGIPRRYAFYLASIFLLLYVTMIGLPASALRAGLMGFLVLWALHLGRLNKITNALILAAAVMLLINPRLLRDDIGFQLSFLAVAGLAYFYPLLDVRLSRLALLSHEPLKAAKDAFSLTIAAQIFTWPVVAYNFSQISLVSPLANILVLWALPLTLAAGLGAVLIGLAGGALAVFFLPAWLFLNYIISVAGFTANLPFSVLSVDYLWPGWLFIYYLLAGYAIYKIRSGAKADKIAILPLSVAKPR
jgi:competence protein ComEC